MGVFTSDACGVVMSVRVIGVIARVVVAVCRLQGWSGVSDADEWGWQQH